LGVDSIAADTAEDSGKEDIVLIEAAEMVFGRICKIFSRKAGYRLR
jgi:hypothetical protein